MRCSVISLLNRSGNFSSLAGKQQGVILDEQGIWAQSVPMVAINTLAIFQEHQFIGLPTRSNHCLLWSTSRVVCGAVTGYVAGDR
jgi:hypothetical protein